MQTATWSGKALTARCADRDTIVMFLLAGRKPRIPAWAKTEVSDRIQVFAYAALTGKAAWKFEEACAPAPAVPAGHGQWFLGRQA